MLLMYVICIGFVTLVWNSLEGNVIQDWYRIGGGNLRGADAFQTFTLLFSMWVYPFAIVSAWLFFWQALDEKPLKAKIECICRAAVCCYMLYRFCALGLAEFTFTS